jgi:hypothetical protein
MTPNQIKEKWQYFLWWYFGINSKKEQKDEEQD